MSTFDKNDQSLNEATDDIVDIDGELEPIEDADLRTEIVPGDVLGQYTGAPAPPAPALGQSGAQAAPPATGATRFPTGGQPALGQSGPQAAPPLGQSGAQPTPNFRQSGAVPAPPLGQSGAQPAPNFRQSGAQPAPPLGQSGAQPAPPLGQSGAQPAPPLGQSGAQPAPNLGQSGALGAPNLANSGALPGFSSGASMPLSPTGAYGIIPDIGVGSRDEIPVSDEPKTVTKGQRVLGVAATILTAVVASAIIGKLIVDQWVAPGKALLWVGVGVTVPTLLVGILSSWSGKASKVKEFILGVAPALAASAGAVFLAGSWSQGTVRSQAVGMVPDTPEAMSAVLADEDMDVAVAGCSRFGAKHEDPDYRVLLFSALTLRPNLAVSCLERLPADAQVAISASLADRWSRELAAESETPDEAHLCVTAGGLSSLPIERPKVTARLLECALNAPTDEAQACCGTSLAAMVVDDKQWAQYMQDAVPHTRDPRTSTGVFSMAFVPSRLSKPQTELAKKLNFSSPPIQRAAMDFACARVSEGESEAIPYMRASLEGKCDIDPANVPDSRGVWEEICFLAKSELDADRTLPVAETMCHTAQDASVGEAIRTARKIMVLGRKKDLEQSMAKRIDAGYNMILDELDGMSDENGAAADFVSIQDRHRAEDRMEIPGITNRQFANDRDSDFEAFMKARKAQQPWKNPNPTYGDEYRAEQRKK